MDKNISCVSYYQIEMNHHRYWSSRPHVVRSSICICIYIEWSTNGSVTSQSYQVNELDNGQQIDIQSTLYLNFLHFKRTEKRDTHTHTHTETGQNKRKCRWFITDGLRRNENDREARCVSHSHCCRKWWFVSVFFLYKGRTLIKKIFKPLAHREGLLKWCVVEFLKELHLQLLPSINNKLDQTLDISLIFSMK